jgi:hypothetical protein
MRKGTVFKSHFADKTLRDMRKSATIGALGAKLGNPGREVSL